MNGAFSPCQLSYPRHSAKSEFSESCSTPEFNCELQITARPMIKNVQQQTEFLNVDLDIYSARNLTPLVEAFGDKIMLLHLGRHKRTWETHLELSKHPIKSPNSVIRDFFKLVRALPPDAKLIWDSAKIRQFNIGIQAGIDQPNFWSVIEAETVKSAAELCASLAITIYPARMEMTKGRLGKIKSSESE
jgi:hypothetical protein